MRRILLLLVAVVAVATAWAITQDIIVKKDGSVLNVYNLEEGKEVFYYTLEPSPNAQVLKINKSEVFTTKADDTQSDKPQDSHVEKCSSAPKHQPVTATFTWEIEPMKIKKGKTIGRKFVAQTPDGHRLNYQVLSEDSLTLQVIKGDYNMYDNYIIPEYVMVDNKKYIVTEIGEKGFYFEKDIKEIQLPYTLIKIGKEAFSKTEFKNIVFPNGLQIIDDFGFSDNCLERIILPESLVLLGKCVFVNSSLNEMFYEIYIPSSIRKIGRDCFRAIGKNVSWSSLYQGYISNMPDFITEENCKEYGIDDKAVRAYRNSKSR